MSNLPADGLVGRLNARAAARRGVAQWPDGAAEWGVPGARLPNLSTASNV